MTDPDHYLRFSLSPNQQIRATGLSESKVEADLVLWDAKHPVGSKPLKADRQDGATSELYYNRSASAPKEVWLQVRAREGSGTVGITWAKRNATSLRQKLSAKTISYGKAATIKGHLYDLYRKRKVGKARVTLWESAEGRYWRKISTKTSNAKGDYSFSVKPKVLRYYRTTTSGVGSAGVAVSGRLTVKPRAYLSTPKVPKTVRVDRNWTISSELKPHHKAGGRVVKFSFYRLEKKKWKLRKTYWAVSKDYKRHTLTRTPVSLSWKGKWRVRAYHASAEHAATYSPWRYFTVK